MAARQLSDATVDGTLLGQSITDKIAAYGGTPVVQPSGAELAAVTRGAPAGVVTTYSTTQSPTAVLTITSTESSFTVQTGTGGSMLPATTDLFFVNKPTAQAGLGYGNVVATASNVVRVNFINPTAGTLTPTASEVYKLVGLRGLGNTLAVLSPASVPANITMEQLFSVGSLPTSELVQVNKPTNQAGLDIVGCRITSTGLLGITFANVTAAPIVPTAAQTYVIFALNGVDAANNYIHYQMNMGTIGAIGPGVVVTGGSTTLTGALATDQVVSIQKPTLQAAATNAAIVYPGGSIFTADVFTCGFFGVGTGYTPTASEVYGITAFRANPVGPLVLYSQSLAPVSVAANTCAEQTFTVTGLIAGTPVFVNKPSFQAGLGIAGVRVSALNTLAVNYINTTGTAIVPTTETYTIGNFQLPAPGTGNSVSQAAIAAIDDNIDLANGLRTALGPTKLNLIAAG